MPSPVIGSTTPAASPANSTRPCVSRVAVVRGGDRPRATRALGLGARAEDVAQRSGRSRSSRHCAASSLPRRAPLVGRAARRSRRWRARRRSGNTHAYPGRRSRSNSTHRRWSSTPVKYWRNACHVPRSAVASRSQRAAADGGPVAVGGDDARAAATACRRRASTVDARRSAGDRRRSTADAFADVDARVARRGRRARRRARRGAPRRRTRRRAGAAARPRGRSARRARSRAPARTTAASRTSSPSASRSRSAPVVRPSPQVLSRGNGPCRPRARRARGGGPRSRRRSRRARRPTTRTSTLALRRSPWSTVPAFGPGGPFATRTASLRQNHACPAPRSARPDALERPT